MRKIVAFVPVHIFYIIGSICNRWPLGKFEFFGDGYQYFMFLSERIDRWSGLGAWK